MNSTEGHSASLSRLVGRLWGHRSLILTLTRREVVGRYKGSVFGILWSFINPLVMLSVFTFVFGEIFKAKWGGDGPAQTGHLEFAVALFAGLLQYNLFAECIGKAPYLVTNQPNYVKKIVFPLDTLPVVAMLAALFHFAIAYGIILVLAAISQWQFHWTVLYTPLIMMPFVLLVLGVTWGLAALGVYLRDIGQLVPPALTAFLFLSPVFYPLSAVSPKLQVIYRLNPLTQVIEQVRGALLFGRSPDWATFWPYAIVCTVIGWLGFVVFQKTRQGFADVI
ncbi:ABC transporter permease [Hydrogenophaga sp.]|uniref:ABC transporter permease n=1 Tax=Hydrogenophaga sp. TaxID=1904254 RepID=UPI0035AF883B